MAFMTAMLRLLWSHNGRVIPVMHTLSIPALYFSYSRFIYYFLFELQDMGQKRSTSHPQLEAEKKKTDKSSSQPSPILVIPSIKYNTGGTFISALLRGESAIGRH